MFNHLPVELIKYIESYIFGNCDYCKKEKPYFQLRKNVFLKEYKSVFHDDYHWYAFDYYKLLCLDCIDNLYHLENKIIYH